MRSEACIWLILITAVLLVYWQVGDHEFINYDTSSSTMMTMPT